MCIKAIRSSGGDSAVVIIGFGEAYDAGHHFVDDENITSVNVA